MTTKHGGSRADGPLLKEDNMVNEASPFLLQDKDPKARARGDAAGTVRMIRDFATEPKYQGQRPRRWPAKEMRETLRIIKCLASDALKEMGR